MMTHTFAYRYRIRFLAAALLCLPSLLGGCVTEHIDMWGDVDQAVAVLHPTQGNNTQGVVRFYQLQDGVKVVADVRGLQPNAMHAIHIHEFGDCTAPDGTSAGGHYNPEDHPHGLPGQADRHAGDLGNLQADANGRARFEITVDNLSVAEMENPVIARAVIVHAGRDTGAQPTGEAGARIACGVIGIARTTSVD